MNNYLQLRYALYERTTTGYQWTWRAGDLKDALLDDFKYRIQMPDDAKDILPSHLVGGLLKFSQVKGASAEDHIVFFRFFNGGSDEGRSRVTMLAAWTTKSSLDSLTSTNGILDVLRNATFEDVSQKAKAIGIEQPYSLIANESISTTAGESSISFERFLQGIHDEDNDYLLTIRNEQHQLIKTPSALVKFRESEVARSKQEEDKRNAQKRKKEDEVAFLVALEKKKQAKEEENLIKLERDKLAMEKASRKRRSRIEILQKFIRILSLMVIFATVGVYAFSYLSRKPREFDDPSLVEEIEDRFRDLSADDQAKVLGRLHSFSRSENEQSLSPPRPLNRSIDPQRPRNRGSKDFNTESQRSSVRTPNRESK